MLFVEGVGGAGVPNLRPLAAEETEGVGLGLDRAGLIGFESLIHLLDLAVKGALDQFLGSVSTGKRFLSLFLIFNKVPPTLLDQLRAIFPEVIDLLDGLVGH